LSQLRSEVCLDCVTHRLTPMSINAMIRGNIGSRYGGREARRSGLRQVGDGRQTPRPMFVWRARLQTGKKMSEPAMTDFRMFAGYNDWANKRLYEATARLPDASYRAAVGVYFGSLHGTLNHTLVADRIWMRHFTCEGPLPVRLDEILHDELPALTEARHHEDERIIAYIAGLNEAELDSAITYETVTNPALQPPDPSPRSGPRGPDDDPWEPGRPAARSVDLPKASRNWSA